MAPARSRSEWAWRAFEQPRGKWLPELGSNQPYLSCASAGWCQLVSTWSLVRAGARDFSDARHGLARCERNGSPSWARTSDLRINSPTLYQLSYRGAQQQGRRIAAGRPRARIRPQAFSGGLRRPLSAAPGAWRGSGSLDCVPRSRADWVAPWAIGGKVPSPPNPLAPRCLEPATCG